MIRMILGIFLGISLAVPWITVADSASSQVAAGNRDFRAGNYAQALEAYSKALVEEPESPRIFFNEGAAYYMKGDYNKAQEQFSKAGEKSKDPAFEALAKFNKGNTFFRESERQRDSDLNKSLAALENSISEYQKAYELDPTLQAAAHNIEIARLVMKQILDELKKQQEAQKENQQKQQELMERLKKLLAQQQELAQGSEQLEQQSSAAEPGEVEAGAERLQDEQAGLKDQTAELSQELQVQSSGAEPSPNVAAGKHLEKSVEDQEQAVKRLQGQFFKRAGESQAKSADSIQAAIDALSKNQNQCNSGQDSQNSSGQNSKQQQQQESADKPPENEPSQDSAQQQPAALQPESAEDILDQERQDRERRQLMNQGGQRRVDRDW